MPVASPLANIPSSWTKLERVNMDSIDSPGAKQPANDMNSPSLGHSDFAAVSNGVESHLAVDYPGHRQGPTGRVSGAVQRTLGAIGKRWRNQARGPAKCRSLDASLAGPNDLRRNNSEGDLIAALLRGDTRFRLRSSGRSHKGRKHDEGDNEDTFFFIDNLYGDQHSVGVHNPPPATIGPVSLYGVFDGHGGRACSDLVSEFLPTAVAESSAWEELNVPRRNGTLQTREENMRATTTLLDLKEDVLTLPDGDSQPVDDQLLEEVMKKALLDGFRKVDERFMAWARQVGNSSGSTAVVALVCRQHVVMANLGDSGGALYRQNTWVEDPEPVEHTKVRCDVLFIHLEHRMFKVTPR